MDVDEIDPKAYADRIYRTVCSSRELEVAFEYAGFLNVESQFFRFAGPSRVARNDSDGYWLLTAEKEGTHSVVLAAVSAIIVDFSLDPIEPPTIVTATPLSRIVRHVSITLPPYQIEHSMGESIVSALLEDIDADLPSHKSEVRILPTDDPHRFDVTLLTGFDPIYIGTISHKGNVWRPVEVMKGIPRAFRSRLHFVGPQKEDVAMAMVQVLRPIWKRLIAPHLTDTLEAKEDDDRR